jgi:hypothetical protein
MGDIFSLIDLYIAGKGFSWKQNVNTCMDGARLMGKYMVLLPMLKPSFHNALVTSVAFIFKLLL